MCTIFHNLLGKKFSKFYRGCLRYWGSFHLVIAKASSDPNKVICSHLWSDVKPENRLSRVWVIWLYLPNHLTKITQNFTVSSSSSYIQLSCWKIFQISILRWSKNLVWTDCSELTDLQEVTINSKSLRQEASKILNILQKIKILCSYISYYSPNLFWGDFHILKIQGIQSFKFSQIL